MALLKRSLPNETHTNSPDADSKQMHLGKAGHLKYVSDVVLPILFFLNNIIHK